MARLIGTNGLETMYSFAEGDYIWSRGGNDERQDDQDFFLPDPERLTVNQVPKLIRG